MTTSEVTIAEVLAKPYIEGAEALIADYKTVFADGGSVALASGSRVIIERAACVRAETRLKLVDAIHLATAVEIGASFLLSNDAGIVDACQQPLAGMLLAELVDV